MEENKVRCNYNSTHWADKLKLDLLRQTLKKLNLGLLLPTKPECFNVSMFEEHYKLNKDMFVNKYSFDVHNHAQTYDQLNAQHVALTHDEIRFKERAKHRDFLTFQKLEWKE